MEKVKVSAPGKLMLFGEHAVVYGFPCIVAAVDQRMQVVAETLARPEIVIDAPDVGIIGYTKKVDLLKNSDNLPKGVQFLETAVKNFFEKYQVKTGLKIKTTSKFSSQFGFGSSSAVTVSVLKALSLLLEIKLSKKELFKIAYRTVLDVQGVGSGFDLAAALWGGVIYYVLGGKRIAPLEVKNLPLVVGYSGVKADTPSLVYQVNQLYRDNRQVIKSVFKSIDILTRQAKKALIKKDFSKIGQLMDINQGLLDALGVNTLKLSRLIFAARKGGALGAKISGAGGGDCMIALVGRESEPIVKSAIRKAGGKVIEVKISAEGVRVE